MEDNSLVDYFKLKVDDIRNRIIAHQENIEINAAWLFVATLGCWSISEKHIKFIAVLLILYLFIRLVFGNKKAQAVDKILKEIKSEIEESEINEDSKKARYFDIEQISKELLSYKAIPKRAPQFLVCYAFWAISFMYFMYEL